MPWLWRSNGSESQRTRPDHREDVRVVVFPRVPPFRNVGREGKGGGGQSGSRRVSPVARLVAAPRAHAASLPALSPVPPVSCSGQSLFFRGVRPANSPEDPTYFPVMHPTPPGERRAHQFSPVTKCSFVETCLSPKGKGRGLLVLYFSGWRAATISIIFSTKNAGKRILWK